MNNNSYNTNLDIDTNLQNILKGRFIFIDLIKIISIFIIFVTHYLMDIGIINHMFSVDRLYSFIDRPNIHLGMLSCSMFIICSGFGLSAFAEKKYNSEIKKENLCKFYTSRLIRVLIPFYVTYFIYYILRIINQKNIFIFGGVPKWRIIFTILGIDEYISANGIRTFTLGIGEWYLGCLILCYLFFPLIYNLTKKMPKATLTLMTIYFVLTPFFINNFVIVPHMNFLTQIYNFYLGILLYTSGIFKKENKQLFLISIIFVVFIYAYPIKLEVYYIFICTLFSLAVFIIFSYIDKFLSNGRSFVSFIKVFNKYSYEFFLCHHFVIYQVDYLLRYGIISKSLFIILFFVDLALTIVFAFSVNVLSNKLVLNRIKK